MDRTSLPIPWTEPWPAPAPQHPQTQRWHSALGAPSAAIFASSDGGVLALALEARLRGEAVLGPAGLPEAAARSRV